MKMLPLGLGVMVASVALATTARAELGCGSMLMPAGQLKEVSRGVSAHHAGLDLVAPHGSPLRAAASGTVVAAQPYFAYGLLVDIAHGGGVVTRYAHMSGFAPGIRPGAQVAAGQLIGQVGRTGRATTAHVHFEVRLDGRPVDPKPYLSLAACTPRTPAVRIEEARAKPAPNGRQATGAQVVGAQAAGNLIMLPQIRLDRRPGGLLD